MKTSDQRRYEYLKAKFEGTAMPHSPEPWRVDEHDDGAELIDANGDQVLDAYISGEGYCSIADGRRVVACVNFLRNVPTEELERFMDVERTIDRMSNLADMGWI